MIEGITTVIKGDSEIITEVGQNKATTMIKVFPVVCPQGEEMPYIICATTGCEEKECKDLNGQPTDETFDVLVYAKEYPDVVAIERRVIDLLTNFSGEVVTVNLKEIILVTHRDMWDNDVQAYVRVASFKASGYFLTEFLSAFTNGFSLGFKS